MNRACAAGNFLFFLARERERGWPFQNLLIFLKRRRKKLEEKRRFAISRDFYNNNNNISSASLFQILFFSFKENVEPAYASRWGFARFWFTPNNFFFSFLPSTQFCMSTRETSTRLHYLFSLKTCAWRPVRIYVHYPLELCPLYNIVYYTKEPLLNAQMIKE